MSILSAIVERKRKEVIALPTAYRASTLPKYSFVNALKHGKPGIIAEVKPKSPSHGELFDLQNLPKLLAAYAAHADAVSVLCDGPDFGGSFDLLSQVSSQLQKPTLAKEFIIDARQIALADSSGASAVLLIAAILDDSELEHLLITALDLRCDVLLEIHTEAELLRCAKILNTLPASLQKKVALGINNRSLDTLKIDLAVTEKLAPLVYQKVPNIGCIVSESGIESVEDIKRLKSYVDAFLIGTSILMSPDPALFLTSLQQA